MILHGWDRTCLALDLGSKTGFAYNENSASIDSGSKLLVPDKEMKAARRDRMDRRCDPRILAFQNFLSTIAPPDFIVFEDVQFSSYTLQCQLWASLRAVIWTTFGGNHTTIIETVPVGTLKKFATGHGGATKEMMRAALVRLHPNMVPLDASPKSFDDNAVDAVWLWLWARKNLSRIPLDLKKN